MPELTADEAKRIRLALMFGDPANAEPSQPDPKLDAAKAKLRAIEVAEAAAIRERWRQEAVERWHDSRSHVEEADTNPAPHIEAAADAAVGAVLHHLMDKSKTDGDSGVAEELYALEVELERVAPDA